MSLLAELLQNDARAHPVATLATPATQEHEAARMSQESQESRWGVDETEFCTKPADIAKRNSVESASTPTHRAWSVTIPGRLPFVMLDPYGCTLAEAEHAARLKWPSAVVTAHGVKP